MNDAAALATDRDERLAANRPLSMPMRFLLAPNAYKGSLTAVEAARAMASGVGRGWPGTTTDECPVADGGDGFLEVLVAATGGTIQNAPAPDPLGRPRTAEWGLLGDGETAVVEMARASGLALLRDDERDTLRASTFGTGELMAAALASEPRRLLIGIGGSATTDGGTGALAALGARFLDAAGQPLPPGGGSLRDLAAIDLSGLRLPEAVEITVACDVTNPLLGPRGAAAVFGPQKGASPADVTLLDAGLARLADVTAALTRRDIRAAPGAGAAGGMGFGLMAFLGARMSAGVDVVLEAVCFQERVLAAQVVLTGEGRYDEQTGGGKAVAGVAARARAAGVPVVALCGAVPPEQAADEAAGISALVSLVPGPASVGEAMGAGGAWLEAAAERVARLLCLGSSRRG
jgi:glycerate 2-kinase